MLQVATQQPRISPAGEMLLRVFRVLDDANAPYCVTHGYSTYPHQVESDVDCLMSAAWLPGRLAKLLHVNREQLGARVVQWFNGQSHYVVLAGTDAPGGETHFLHLHVSSDVSVARRHLYDAAEVLQHRRRHGEFWIPAARHEYACMLARRIEKCRFTDEHVRHLRELEHSDAAGCTAEAARWFGDSDERWNEIDANLPAMRRRLLRRAALRNPGATLRNAIVGAARIVKRAWDANRGLSIVILGPDGSGKSSLVESLRQDWAGAFVGSQRRTFPPALLNRKMTAGNSTPHAVKPRSWMSSVARAIGYWMTYHVVGHYFTVGRAKAQGKLVIHDRHLLDCLVDPKRYRYAGPMGLLRAIARMIHKSDMVMLLDAPAEVIQRRKQEVPLFETARQLGEYRKLVSRMANARVIDVNRPLPEVVETVNRCVAELLSRRVASRFDIEDADANWLRELLHVHGESARMSSTTRDASSHRFAILPSRRNPRWFIPLDNPAVSAAALCLATPTNLAARAIHALTCILARTGIPLWYRDEIRIAQSSTGEIETVMQRLFPGRDVRLGITLGSPPPTRNRKISLAVIDRQGTIVAFAKLPGTSEASHRSVRAEAAALRQLESTGIAAPRLLWAGEVDGRYMTVASSLRGRSAGLELGRDHHAFLARLRRGETKCAAETAFAGVLRRRANFLESRDRDILDRVLADLSSMQLPSTIVHGDFAPWNLRIDKSGRLEAFDWEYMQIDALPLIDEIHHLLAVGCLVKRWSAARAIERLDDHSASRPLGYSANVVRALQCVYLLDYMLRLRSEGYEPDYSRYVWCREILIALAAKGGAA